MSYNLLKMTQLILSSMDSDEVDSIGDTTESLQVVDVIEQTYNDLVSTMDFPEQDNFFEMDTLSDSSLPTWMTLPDNVMDLESIEYNNSLVTETDRNWQPVFYLPVYDFLQRMNTLDTADSNVYQYNYLNGTQTLDIRGYNDAFPGYYTIINDHDVIFDHYHVVTDLTLVSNKTQCFGKIKPTFTRSDTWTSPFDEDVFSIFFNECKSQASIEIKQMQNPKADQRVRIAKSRSVNNKDSAPQGLHYYAYPNFGRRSRVTPGEKG